MNKEQKVRLLIREEVKKQLNEAIKMTNVRDEAKKKLYQNEFDVMESLWKLAKNNKNKWGKSVNELFQIDALSEEAIEIFVNDIHPELKTAKERNLYRKTMGTGFHVDNSGCGTTTYNYVC